MLRGAPQFLLEQHHNRGAVRNHRIPWGRPMTTRVLTILFVATLFAGCCTFTRDGGFCSRSINSVACNSQVDGYTRTVILYGDSKIAVVPISHVRSNTEWRFRLQPVVLPTDNQGIDYNNVDVTITGKPAQNPLPPDHNDWITVSGSYNGAAGNNHNLVLCTKANLGAQGTTYEYEVKVDTVGIIDPRADVC